MDELERRLTDIVARIRSGEAAAFDELGRIVTPLSAYYLLGAGVGVHAVEAPRRAARWVTSVVASAHAARPPYVEWLAHTFEELVHRDFFQDAAALQMRVSCELPPLPPGILAHAMLRPRQRVSGDVILVEQSGSDVW